MKWLMMFVMLVGMAAGQTVPKEFFGLHQIHTQGCDGPPLDYPFSNLPVGTFRLWDSCSATWYGMNPSKDVYSFAELDVILSDVKRNGATDALITLGRVPNWISANPNDQRCDNAGEFGQPNGMCQPPADINPDGSGTDLAFRTFLVNLLTHVTAPGYSQNHAPIRYYEIWNEVSRSDTISDFQCNPSPPGPSCSYRGTFAQILRMTQDARCIIKGILTEPITGSGKTCGSAGYGKTGYDPQAQIVPISSGPATPNSIVMANWLYCNQSPPQNSQCNWSSQNPLGSNATDVINGHPYYGSQPEQMIMAMIRQRRLFSAVDNQKPYFAGEGGWGLNKDETDPNLSAGSLARWYLSLWMGNVQRVYWYYWSGSGSQLEWGTLWSPVQHTFGNGQHISCQVPNTEVGGFDCTGGIAYQQLIKWIQGKDIIGWTCSTDNCEQAWVLGTYTVSVTQGSYRGIILWDNTTSGPCANPQCGTIPYTVPAWVTQWRDLAGQTHQGKPQQIGAEPIIAEIPSNGPPSAPQNVTVTTIALKEIR